MPDAIDWQVESRPVPDELTPGYNHAIYVAPEPTFFPPLVERIGQVMREKVSEMFGAM